MSEADIVERLRQGGVKLAFDTNAVAADSKFTRLCNGVSLWNQQLKARKLPTVQLIVCTVAHAEKLFDLKQKFRDTFDMDVILAQLESKGVRIEPFSASHALEVAVRLGRAYPDSKAWRQAKKERCLSCVGLPRTTSAPGTGEQCGATVDWLIGGHAQASACILVTNDKDPEFEGVERVELAPLVAALQQLVGKPS